MGISFMLFIRLDFVKTLVRGDSFRIGIGGRGGVGSSTSSGSGSPGRSRERNRAAAAAAAAAVRATETGEILALLHQRINENKIFCYAATSSGNILRWQDTNDNRAAAVAAVADGARASSALTARTTEMPKKSWRIRQRELTRQPLAKGVDFTQPAPLFAGQKPPREPGRYHRGGGGGGMGDPSDVSAVVPCELVIDAHSEAVQALCFFDPDASQYDHMVSACAGGRIRVWAASATGVSPEREIVVTSAAHGRGHTVAIEKVIFVEPENVTEGPRSTGWSLLSTAVVGSPPPSRGGGSPPGSGAGGSPGGGMVATGRRRVWPVLLAACADGFLYAFDWKVGTALFAFDAHAPDLPFPPMDAAAHEYWPPPLAIRSEPPSLKAVAVNVDENDGDGRATESHAGSVVVGDTGGTVRRLACGALCTRGTLVHPVDTEVSVLARWDAHVGGCVDGLACDSARAGIVVSATSAAGADGAQYTVRLWQDGESDDGDDGDLARPKAAMSDGIANLGRRIGTFGQPTPWDLRAPTTPVQ